LLAVAFDPGQSPARRQIHQADITRAKSGISADSSPATPPGDAVKVGTGYP
jgi:hypothetical protein